MTKEFAATTRTVIESGTRTAANSIETHTQVNPADTQTKANSVGGRTKGASERPAVLTEWGGTDRYRVVRRIGEGGMGVVYEAFDLELKRSVAVKTLLYFTPAALYRFKQEFRTLADVHHKNLVRLHELVVPEGDVPFFVMEFVRGTDFQGYIERRPSERPPRSSQPPGTSKVPPAAGQPPGTSKVPPAAGSAGRPPSPAHFDRLRVAFRQLVEGVQALHSDGKLHRDIKPSNVLVTPEGRIVILDFGVATELSRVEDANLSEEREVVGTVRYMSPEQAFAEEPTAASDWYSVGVVLYEALTGSAPFTGASMEVLTKKTSEDPVPASECVDGIPEDLDALCRALLDREPDRRPTGAEILRRLGATRSDRPILSLIPGDGGKLPPLVGRDMQLQALRDAFEQVVAGGSITVRVGGAPGMGKSAVAQYFLDGLVERGEAVVLRGRTYERESLPFKAFDTVIDQLSRYLLNLEDQGNGIELPDHVGALARLFPVLRRVRSIAALAEMEVIDPQQVRRTAFSALRELLARLANLQPLVIYVDDVQWGDTDSAALLFQLTRPPQAPPILFLLAHRDTEVKASPFLKEMSVRWPEGAESREVTVGPLDTADAQSLALALLEENDERAHRTARAVARESRGTPFLVEELVRSNRASGTRPTESAPSVTLTVLTLEQMVGQRLERLNTEARLLLELVAVGGRPVPVALVSDASGVSEGLDEAIGMARSRRLLRVGLRDGREVVETTHDRFRETIIGQLSADVLRQRHVSLAAAHQAAPLVDAEATAVHLVGAGENQRAAEFSQRAAEEAVTKLAFDQAAGLFRMTLEITSAPPEETQKLKRRLAQVLEWSGRSEEAARAYLEATEGAPPLERAELERAASVGLLASGRIVEGAEVLRRTLTAVGLKTPSSVLGTIFSYLFYTIRLKLWFLFGARVEEREPDSVPPEERVRIDALFAASFGISCADILLGAAMASRSLVAAIRGGDRFQLLRAALLVTSNNAGIGGKPKKFELALIELATRLVEKDGSEAAKAFLKGNLGVGIYLRGDWAKARETLKITAAAQHDLSAGWLSNAKVFDCWSLNFLGEHRELQRRHALLMAEADQLGDRYMSVQLRDGSIAIMWLAADDVEGARRNIRESMALWPTDRYLLQHWHQLYGETEIELYLGEGAKAYARIERDMPALKRSLILGIQHMRAQTLFLRGRAAIASLDVDPALRGKRIVEVQQLARLLAKEDMAWTAPMAAFLDAAAAHAEGKRKDAVAGLQTAIELAHAADMHGYVMAGRYQLGSLLGGDEGQQVMAEAEEGMRAQKIRVPARFAATLVPGRWAAP